VPQRAIVPTGAPTEPTTAPTDPTTPPVAGGLSPTNGGALSSTGADVMPWITGGSLVLAAGAGLLLVARRRHRAEQGDAQNRAEGSA